MKTTAVAGICAVLLILAGFSLSHLSARNKELTKSVMTLRLEVKAQAAAIETHAKALKEAEEHARARQEELEAALYAAGIWADTDLPDSVRQLLQSSAACSHPAAGLAHVANNNPGQVAGQNTGRLGTSAH